MRPMKRGVRWVGVSLVTLVAVVGPALAYVNGGDFITTLKKYPEKLRSEGWAVGCAWELPGAGREFGLRPEALGKSEQPDAEKRANQLVVRAVQGLALKDSDQVSTEDKRELAKIALEAIQSGGVKEGKTGALTYRVGTYSYESYWRTDYEREGERIHAKRTGVVPFVAVKVVDE